MVMMETTDNDNDADDDSDDEDEDDNDSDGYDDNAGDDNDDDDYDHNADEMVVTMTVTSMQEEHLSCPYVPITNRRTAYRTAPELAFM